MQQRFMSTAFLCTTAAALFSASAAANPVSVKDGVLQWQNGSEVALFGVNYSAPLLTVIALLNVLAWIIVLLSIWMWTILPV